LKRVPLSLIAALIFSACATVAAWTVLHALMAFATEAGVAAWIFVAVPGLCAALFAILVYGSERAEVSTTRESMSRGLLVALLTWPAIAALATAVWFPTEHFSTHFSTLLLATAAVGGGQILLATLAAGALTGLVIQTRLR
jgi:hypothetical protein